MTRLLFLIIVPLIALFGCSASPAASYSDLESLEGKIWQLVDMKGLNAAIEKKLKEEELDGSDFDLNGIIVGLQVSTRRNQFGDLVSLSVGICNGVAASYKTEGAVLTHTGTSIHPAGCGASVKKNGKIHRSYAPLAVEQHYQKIAPDVRYVVLSPAGDALVFKDKKKRDLAMFKPFDAADFKSPETAQ